MAAKGIDFTLMLGATVPKPAPSELIMAFQSASVQVGDSGPIRFQITFRSDPVKTWAAVNPIVGHALLQPFTRVAVLVKLGMSPTVLVDGFITHQQFDPGTEGQAAGITVSGEDVSVLMDIEQKSTEYTGMDEAGIVKKILLSYMQYGLTGSVKSPKVTDKPLPDNETRMQQATDRAYVQELAGEAGFVTYVEPGASVGVNTFYFGPPSRSGRPQPAISINQGSFSNASGVTFEYDARAPTKAVAYTVSPDKSQAKQEKVEVTTTTLTALSAKPALTSLGTHLRTTLIRHGGSSIAKSKQIAQGAVDESVQSVVTASGTLQVSRYGAILQPRKLVDLRGAGKTWDGTWYVKSVAHSLSGNGYTQSFNLAREGLTAKSGMVRV